MSTTSRAPERSASTVASSPIVPERITNGTSLSASLTIACASCEAKPGRLWSLSAMSQCLLWSASRRAGADQTRRAANS